MPSTSLVRVTPPSTTAASTPVTSPSAPATPTVPADVPTTGPNAKAGEAPPLMPLAATKHTPAGARSFAAFFIKTIDWGYATTSASYMRHYFTSACVECSNAANALDKARQRHHRYIGDRFMITRTGSASPRGAAFTVTVTFDVSSVEVVDAHNKFVDGDAALTGYRETISLGWRPSGWLVIKMVPL
jgi:hypothetical protein